MTIKIVDKIELRSINHSIVKKGKSETIKTNCNVYFNEDTVGIIIALTFRENVEISGQDLPAGYKGPIIVTVTNNSDRDFPIYSYDEIGKLIILEEVYQ